MDGAFPNQLQCALAYAATGSGVACLACFCFESIFWIAVACAFGSGYHPCCTSSTIHCGDSLLLWISSIVAVALSVHAHCAWCCCCRHWIVIFRAFSCSVLRSLSPFVALCWWCRWLYHHRLIAIPFSMCMFAFSHCHHSMCCSICCATAATVWLLLAVSSFLQVCSCDRALCTMLLHLLLLTCCAATVYMSVVDCDF